MKKALLVVSFGTTHLDTLEKTIKRIETDLSESFPEYDLFRVFTSGMIRDRLKKRDGVKIHSPESILKYLKEHDYNEILIQPTHIIPGIEYQKIENSFNLSDKEIAVSIGEPLLYSHEDFIDLRDFFDYIIEDPEPDTAVLLMGHGTDERNNLYYPALDYYLNEKGKAAYFVATVEGYPDFDMVKERIKDNYKKVILIPLMIVAGEHVKNDMLNNPNSWKNQLEKLGLEVVPLVKGLGEYSKIRELFIKHAKRTIK